MTHDEVLKSYNANWKRFRNGEMDFSKYFIKKRAFWSKQSTLKGNDKRKVTCKIKNEPVVEESKRMIYEAIEILMKTKDKITQIKVEEVSGMSISTVKTYWNEFKDVVKSHNMTLRGEQKAGSNTLPENKYNEDVQAVKSNIPTSESIQQISAEKKADITDIQNIEIIDYDDDTLVLGEEFKTTQGNINTQLIFERIFAISLKRLDENEKNQMFAEFNKNLRTLPQSDINILTIDVNEIEDSNTFFKQSTLESQIWQRCMASFTTKE